jgi:transcriptional regulator with XRE-family HTH domain
MKHIDYHRIHNSLRKYRKARGLTQKEVSLILGLKSEGIVSRWEIGRSLPKTLNVLKLAILYRTMADALFIDLRRALQKDIFEAEEKFLKNKHHDQGEL